MAHRGAAMEFLARLDPATYRRGTMLFEGGGVLALICVTEGTVFRAEVADQGVARVTLSYDAEAWSASCTCGGRAPCRHGCATMLALLQDEPRLLKAKTKPPPPPPPVGGLHEHLVQALGRPLRAEEASFVRQIRQLYRSAQQIGQLTPWDLQRAGLFLPLETGRGLDLWPTLPKNELEFWLYLVHALHEVGAGIPRFMEPVSDPAPIQRQLDTWKYEKEVAVWRERLALTAQTTVAPARECVDLRLCLTRGTAFLLHKPASASEFARVNPTALHRLALDYEEGALEVVPEAFPLWHACVGSWKYGARAELFLDSPETSRVVHALVRNPALQERIVTEPGEPFAHALEPLRWQVEPPEADSGKYRFFLVLPNGQPAPPIHATLLGQPTLYLTATAVYVGPPAVAHVLQAGQINAIPAPALESPEGLTLFEHLNLPLPTRVATRVRRVEVPIRIQCNLKKLYQGSGMEVVWV